MSFHSSTLTYACDPALAGEHVEMLKRGEKPDRSTCEFALQGGSRNSWTERCLSLLVDIFQLRSLACLRRAFAAGSDVQPDGHRWATQLQPEELQAAITGVHALLITMREHPDAFLELSGLEEEGYTEDDIVGEVARPDEAPPASLEEALRLHDEAVKADDADHPRALFAFLQAHAMVLEAAQERGRAVVYSAWLGS